MKTFALAAGAALTMTLVITPAATATVKEGAACKKVGQVSTVAGRKFTCIKKSGKLVWGKGVAVMSTPSASATPAPSKSAEPSKSAAPVAAGYTMERVRANNTSSSCWSVISGNVYDLTKWINSHPGGSGAIISLCGKDGTADFMGMHAGQGKPQSRLAGYLLGPLAK